MKFRFAKYLALIVLLSMPFYSSKTYGQARPSPASQVLSLDFVPLIISGTLAFQYEYKVDPVTSWLLRLHFWPSPATDYTGYGFGAAYRIYIADSRALTGLAVAPAADVFLFSGNSNNTASAGKSGEGVDIGGDLSYKWIFDQFAVEPIFGLRFGIGSNYAPSAFTTIQPLIGCSLGYAW